MCSARADDAGPGAVVPAGAIRFDLPAQPLAQTLQVFGRMTELAVIVPSPLLEGRTSAPVSGSYLPRDALRLVLAGTGLRAEFTGVDEAIIAPDPDAPVPASAAVPVVIPASSIDGMPDGPGYSAYAAMVQTRLTEALCASDLTRPGDYRLVAQLRLNDAGTVVASDLVESTGLPSRDAAIAQRLRTLTLDAAPPAGLPEPITILLRPAGGGVHIRCPQPGGRD